MTRFLDCGISELRIDYGFDAGEIVRMSQNPRIQGILLNATEMNITKRHENGTGSEHLASPVDAFEDAFSDYLEQ